MAKFEIIDTSKQDVKRVLITVEGKTDGYQVKKEDLKEILNTIMINEKDLLELSK